MGDEQNAVFAAGQNRRSQIAFYQQPGGQGNPSSISTVIAGGQQSSAVTGQSAANTWYSNPTWSRQGDKLAFEKLQCFGECVIGEYNYDLMEQSDIVMVDLTSQSSFPDNVTGTFHLEDPDCYHYEGSTDFSLPLSSPSFSPQGDRFVALASGRELPDTNALVVFNIDTGDWHYVGGCQKWYHYIVSHSAPAWNPQDDTIAFYKMTTDQDEPSGGEIWSGGAICVIGSDGENESQITSDEFFDSQPAWSPDGQWIAFISNRDYGDILDIWMVDRHGNNMRKIYDCDPSCFSPTFSPDGLNIAFKQGTGIHTIDIWGNNLTHLNQPYSIAPDWSPAFARPSADISADAAVIDAGQSATLTWTSAQGKSAEIDNGIGDVDLIGSQVVTPVETTTYTLTVSGLGGTATATVTVTVN